VRLAYFQANRLLVELYKQETEIREEKTTGPLKIKQTSITTFQNHILTVARLPTPLIFRYPLPLTASSDLDQKINKVENTFYCSLWNWLPILQLLAA
jgi:hypothetical protein